MAEIMSGFSDRIGDLLTGWGLPEWKQKHIRQVDISIPYDDIVTVTVHRLLDGDTLDEPLLRRFRLCEEIPEEQEEDDNSPRP